VRARAAGVRRTSRLAPERVGRDDPRRGPGAAIAPAAGVARALAPERVATLAAIALLLPPVAAPAQDFQSPAPPAAATPAAFLERGLPGASASPAAEALATQWYEVPDLATRALAASAGWRSIRAAAGISRTGETELGWTTGACALGVAIRGAGAAVRAAARRDAMPGALAAALGPGTGLEAGGAAWVAAGAGITLFASAPQMFTRGVSPPLERGLEIGASCVMDGLSLRLTRVSARGGAGAAQHEAGLALSAGPLTAWLEARDQPARGALGLSARAGFLTIAGAVESHPVLGETVRLSLVLSRRGAERLASTDAWRPESGDDLDDDDPAGSPAASSGSSP